MMIPGPQTIELLGGWRLGLVELEPDILWIGDGEALLDLLLDRRLPFFSFSARPPMGFEIAVATVFKVDFHF